MTTPYPPDSEDLAPSGVGTNSPDPSTPAAAPVPSAADYQQVQASPEFGELRSRFRRFAFPLSAAFLIWYFAYVLLATYAVDFMSKRLAGNFTVGLLLGLLQFVSTFGITALYIWHANKRIDPLASKLRTELEARS